MLRIIGSCLLDFIPTIPLLIIGWLAFPLDNLFAYHPFFVSIAMLGLMPYGVRLMDRHVCWLPVRSRTQMIKWHWVIQCTASVLLILGGAAVYVNKIRSGKSHFTTWHGLCGLLTLVYVVMQLLAGFVLHWRLWPIRLLTYNQASLFHVYSGFGLLILSALAKVLGLQSIWVANKLRGLLPQGCEYVVIVLSAMVCCSILRIAFQIRRFDFRRLFRRTIK
ncbi:hypothetical protein EG68_08603 [Paragonimus skrjabini miyazakii]|uniref:ascorbate ferrireductase (transmembrane) n=1 Tax=Paragonimus skrjabini miyazakii TaxID=59628 RepID=A0A8S9YIY1_9TREM|nr:hypothetical protein EG68_08603 [Paragonimus skrjabini miyazakii]